MLVTTFAALAALLAAPLPPKPADAATQMPTPQQDVGKPGLPTPFKGSVKNVAKPGSPKLVKPPDVPGMRFLFVTPAEFVPVGEARVENAAVANSRVLSNTRITGSGGAGNLIGNTGRDNVVGTAAARVHVPRGARIHWLECALDGLESGGTGTTRVFAALYHVRYADHSWVTPPATLASLEIQMTNDVGNNGRTFLDGVRIDHPRAVETEDGWFTLEVGFIQATTFGLRACRIGYVPAAP